MCAMCRGVLGLDGGLYPLGQGLCVAAAQESDSKMAITNFIMSISGAYFLAEHGYAYLVLPKEVFCSKTKQLGAQFPDLCGLPV